MFKSLHTVLALLISSWSLAITGEEFWISDFASSSAFITPCDINHEAAGALTGVWRTKDGGHEIQGAQISGFSLACIPIPRGRLGIVPLNRDVLSKDDRVPCWIMWVPADEELTMEWKSSIGQCGRLGWIQFNGDLMTVSVTYLRSSKIADYLSATSPLSGPMTLSTSREDFWRKVKERENDIFKSKHISVIKFDRVKSQESQKE